MWSLYEVGNSGGIEFDLGNVLFNGEKNREKGIWWVYFSN